MTPEQLKTSILQAAIQGKLVEQREEEGTGEELYKTILNEKNILIKKGTLKGGKDLDDISSDEIPFDIPNNWIWVRHNSIFEIVGGSQPPKSNFKDSPEDGDVRLYQIRDYGESPVPVYVDRNLVTKFTQEGDILLARYGGSLGKVFWAKEGAYNVAMAKIVMLYKSALVDKNYLYYYYLAPLYQNLVKGGNRAAQGGFNKEDLDTLLFPLPPLEEQHRIVAKIEQLLPYVDRYAASYEKLEQFNANFPEEMKKSILQYAIQGKLVEQRPEEGTAEELYQQIQEEKQKLIKEGEIKKEKALAEITEDEIPFEIPKSWEWIRLGTIISLQSGQDLKPSEYNSLMKGIPYLTGASNIENNGNIVINRWTDTPKAYATKGDLLLTCKGTVGKLAFLDEEKVHIARQIMAIKSYSMDSKFIRYYLETQISDLKGMAKSMIPGIERENVLKLVFPLPPLAEQHRIVAKIEELLPYCDKLANKE